MNSIRTVIKNFYGKKLKKYSNGILFLSTILIEYISILIAEKISLIIQHSLPFPNGEFFLLDLYFYILIPFIYIFFLQYNKANERFILYWETLQRIFWAVLYSEVFCVIVLYLFKSADYISRSYIIIFFVMSFICICIGRNLFIKLCRKLHIMQEQVIFIGAGKTTEKLIEFANNNNCLGIDVVGIFDTKPESKKLQNKYYIFNDFNELKKYIKKYDIKTVIIAIPSIDKVKLFNLIEDLQPIVQNLMFIPNVVGMPVFNLEVKKLYQSNMILLGIRNNLTKKSNRLLKRIFDICFSLLAMILIVPVSIVVMICIMIESPGAMPIFKHYRVGKEGKLFPCYKFRSMVPNAQEKLQEYLKSNPEARAEWNTYFKLKDDPRITKIGRFIRKTSIDELPQFINVLKGEMSWVGPRPIIKDEIHYYGKYINDYYAVLPGITGMWQANGRSDTGYDERVVLDTWYVRNWNIWIDIALIIKTIKAVLFGKGAY